ncbi:spore maturation protein [Pelotomaculum terephthalicicum JT]|uniref:nucleoside recognition domain-containing protein n=1 Tax=Pelotomaculum TaxID=191373 RepID=UPI0009D11E1D|nr:MULTISPECIES: nucleoside recognition domain-containing protein [Pelotomaculum]MCG9968128.1 spore maturation protein [Pelotomaculum terephthalicicum JT]OPX83975.1 MAG: Spore maturation protein A [Pelotomaculum sp. PtaB.Bin117]OPY62914.1 MAG: Spore maturation protein A [Pelotomaculum sp. PtaU1.Bin065]
MVNLVWLGMIVLGILAAGARGNIEIVTKAALDSANDAVKISIGLIAIMTFWLGIMKLAEEAGLIRLLARLVRPVMRFLFPSVPKDHPAMGAIVMNLSANILGLGNAATPMGLIAMRELQKLNRGREDTASEAMCTFLALNTSCVTLIPTTIIGIRLLYGSADPTDIVGPTIMATAFSMVAAVFVDRLLRFYYTGRRG